MRRPRLVTRLAMAALLPLSVLSVVPDAAGGQLGGLLRRKIGEVTKGEEANKETEKGTPTETAVSRAFNDPNVVEISDGVLATLERTLLAEIRLQGELMKELAAMKTPEQYNACKGEVAASPEAQKYVMRLGEIPENATAEQMQNMMLQMGKELEALTLKRCGPDVAQFNDSWRYKRLQEIRRQAIAEGGPPK